MQMRKLYRDERSIMYDNYLKGYTYTLISISGRPDRETRMEGGKEKIPQDEQTVEIYRYINIYSTKVGLPTDAGKHVL